MSQFINKLRRRRRHHPRTRFISCSIARARLSSYRHPIPADFILVTDYARVQELEKSRTDNLFEAGIRRMVTAVSIVSLGAGIDVVHGVQDFRLTFPFQYSLE